MAVMPGFVRSAKGDAGIAARSHELAIRWNCLNVCYCQGNGNRDYVARLERHHHTAFSVYQRAHRARPVIGGQHSIERVGPAAALQVAQHHTPRFFAGECFQLSLAIGADAA